MIKCVCVCVCTKIPCDLRDSREVLRLITIKGFIDDFNGNEKNLRYFLLIVSDIVIMFHTELLKCLLLGNYDGKVRD